MTANEQNKNTPEAPREGDQQPAHKPNSSPFVAFQSVNPAIKPGFMLRKVGQAFMVMPTGPRMKEYQGMITLNETGAFLFKEAQKPEPTKKKLIDACIAEYGATPEEAEKAADAFIIQCAKCGLMESTVSYVDVRTGQQVAKEQIAEELENESAE